ncbi:hypothetical protein CLU79DRAFT_838369 [Phycomyces nitens]|nr:hypothetical protein CLU79DRAFT_838369 [Phycomyces nitens]
MNTIDNNNFQQLIINIQALEGNGEQSDINESASSKISHIAKDLSSTLKNPTDLSPSSELLEAIPGMSGNFFERELDEDNRRRFLRSCPRNVFRNYIPPSFDIANCGLNTRQTDLRLFAIQSRIAEITRPIDWFVDGAISQKSVSLDQALDFAQCIHELLSQTATYITKMRLDNIR